MATSPFWNLSSLERAAPIPTSDQLRSSQSQVASIWTKVPNEMFLAIFKMLAREDIKHFRLVCRLWELLGAPFLMNRVFFGPRRKIMDNFTAISRHPIFSKSIKQISYDVALNDASLLDLEIYKEEFDVSYAPIDEGVYQRGLDRYREVFSDEQAILDTGEDFAVLKAGMDLLPNAKSFVLSDGLRHRCLWHWYHSLDPASGMPVRPFRCPIYTPGVTVQGYRGICVLFEAYYAQCHSRTQESRA